MHIAINAIPIQPGGGLTVLRGLVRSLRACRPAWHITVLTGSDATHESMELLGCASDVHRALDTKNAAHAFVWQSARLGSLLRKRGTEAVIGFNHFQLNVPCPQVVYHLNLRRFCRVYRSRRPSALLQERLRDWLAKRALRRADANVFESRFLRDAAANIFERQPRHASIIYIGLPDDLLAMSDRSGRLSWEGEAPAEPSRRTVAAQQELRPPADAADSRRLVAITSPEPHKDNSTLIRTLARLVRKEPQQDWHLDILGGIEQAAWKPMRRLADGLGVRQRITWHGFQDQDAITRLLRGALCLVSTSQLESFAMVALEAMARGCPPIVADCAAMPESIGDAGLLATPGKPAAFADAVLRIANESRLREQLATRGHAWIRGFRWSRCGVAFAETIESLLDSASSLGEVRKLTSPASQWNINLNPIAGELRSPVRTA